MSTRLPPLNALRAFEAAARTGSYVGAAREIGVSPAAISQQVRNLEMFFDKRLFARHNNRVVLTDAGHAIFAGTTEALQAISTVTEQTLTGTTRSRLVISVLPSVARRWLAPQLSTFVQTEPQIRFALRVEEDPVDFDKGEIDLRICYGTDLYPELTRIELRRDEVLPVCSPGYLARNPAAMGPGLEGVPDEDLIHTDWGPGFGSLPSWEAWFGRYGLVRPGRSKGFVVGMSGLALDFACEGLGVALGQRMLAEEDLRNGRLVALSSLAMPLGHPYSLVYPRGRSRKTGLQKLLAWLQPPRTGGRSQVTT
ncbi:LysR substrate-binding domain-containing protein [Tabrizicola sp. J26]|uniref:LysR substrate-binding domain-containing protein n=1 Tax=Alitabrizicola rongguiensis TaxID=2909234 RepID=UPI001F37618B|nr:LysR substrate-binding domain-containing protein [Tabrizicola rongguiensis]MCF1709369.1 LysR substrate-binding domain-containing protein [Tabrizicola rongguiensis]